jgi:PAS domain S-box-containing protein
MAMGEDTRGAVEGLDYRQVLDAFPDAVVASDLQARIVYVNAAAEDLLGWRAAELVGRSLHLIQPERLHAAHDEGFGRYVATRKSRLIGTPIHLPALHRDGSEIDVELNLARVPFGDGGELIIGVLRDLRERIELERQLRAVRYLRATSEAAAPLSSLLDRGLVAQTVVETLVSHFDSALARIWVYEPRENALRMVATGGFSREPTTGLPALIDLAKDSCEVSRVARSRKAIVKNGLLGDPDFEQDWVEGERIAAAAFFPLLAGDELLGVLVHFTREPIPDEVADILANFVALTAAALNDARLYRDAERATALRDEFLSVAAHELRTPITAVSVYTQLLDRLVEQATADAEAGATTVALDHSRLDRVTARLRDGVGRLNRLIIELLDTARLQRGALDLHYDEADLAEIVDAAVEHARLLREGGPPESLVIELERPVVGVWDADRLRQVVDNLLDNALKYSPAGGEVEVRLTANTEAAELAVADRGIGVPPEELETIFEPFSRGSNASSQEFVGFGMGLAICRDVVRRHGGRLWADSAGPGRGTTFYLRLPRAGRENAPA